MLPSTGGEISGGLSIIESIRPWIAPKSLPFVNERQAQPKTWGATRPVSHIFFISLDVPGFNGSTATVGGNRFSDWIGSMKPSFDTRILVLGLLVLAVLAVRPVERMRVDPQTTGSISVVAPR